MTDGTTTHYGWTMPQDHGSANDWGAKINTDLQAIDSRVWNNYQVFNAPAAIANTLTPNNINLQSAASLSATVSFFNSLAASTHQLRWQWQMDTVAESGAANGSNLNLLAYDNSGVVLSTPAVVLTRTGSATFNSSAAFSGSASFGGLATFNGGAAFPNSITVQGSSGFPLTLQSTTIGPSGINFLNNTAASLAHIYVGTDPNTLPFSSNFFSVNVGSAEIILSYQPGGGGSFFNAFVSSAAKPGGGSWAATTSDARAKTIEGEYKPGLEEVLQLRPVIYRFKGNDAEPGRPASPTNTTFVGLIAQEAERAMPSMVGSRLGMINNSWVNDMRTLDTSELIFALVNCVKGLKAEIDELKARSP